MHLLKDVLAPSELVVGWRKVGMSWIKAKGEATFKNLESTSPKIIHITKTSISPAICAPTWRGKFQTQKTLRIGNILLVPLSRLLAKMIFQVTKFIFGNYL